MFERLFARSPTTIHSLKRIAKRAAISCVIRENSLASLSQIEVMLDGFRVETPERGRIAQIIDEEPRLLRNLIERDFFYAQSGLFGRSVTGSFDGAQCAGLLLSEHFTR